MKILTSGLNVKKSAFVGVIVLLPLFIVLLALNMLIDIVSVRWDPVFDFFGVIRYTEKTSGLAEVLATFLLIYVTGRFLTIKRIRTGILGKTLRSIPLLGFFFRVAFGVIYAIEDLKSFPVVEVETYDGNYSYGVAVGIQKTRIHMANGQVVVKKLLRVYYPDFPMQFNGRGGMVEFRRVKKVLNPVSECMPLFTTAYIAAPDWIDKQPWSDLFNEELENLPSGVLPADAYHLKDLKDLLEKVFEWRPPFLKKKEPKS